MAQERRDGKPQDVIRGSLRKTVGQRGQDYSSEGEENGPKEGCLQETKKTLNDYWP